MPTLTRQQALEAVRAGAVLVTASLRLARTLRADYDAGRMAEGLPVWPSAQICAWQRWLELLWDRVVEDALDRGEMPPLLLGGSQETAVWESIIREAETGRLVNAPATAEQAANAWSLLHSWCADAEEEDDWNRTEDLRAFETWRCRFEEITAQHQWLDPARLPSSLSAAAPGPGAPVLLAGFEEFTPQQEALLEALRRRGWRIDVVEPPARPALSRTACAGLPDTGQEIRAAACWARGLLEQGARAPIGIAVADLGRLRPAVERIFLEVLHPGAVLRSPSEPLFNISLGMPLSGQPLVCAALQIIESMTPGVRAEVASALLRSPFLAGAESEASQRALLEVELRRSCEREVSLRRIWSRASRPREGAPKPHTCPRLGAMLWRWMERLEALPATQRPSAWARSFSELLEIAGWPGERALTSGEYQAWQRWRELLGEFARLDAVEARLTAGQARSRLRRMANAALFQPESSGDEPVQILGLLETSGLEFEHLWVMGLDDEVWPRPARPNPFLPIALQRRHRMPHCSPERELEFARRSMEALLASSPDVIFSYPQHDQDRTLRPSTLLAGIPRLAVDAIGRYAPYAEVVRQSARVEEWQDEQAPAVEGVAEYPGGTRVLQAQAACPFRAFAEFRLDAQPLESPQAGLDDRLRGVLLHKALQHVWARLRDHATLRRSGGQELREIVSEAVSQALDHGAVRNHAVRAGSRFRQLEQRRLEDVLLEFLGLEAARAPFVVADLEQQYRAEIAGLALTVRADRVDAVDGGGRVILDYKSGQPKLDDWWGERPDEPQLPLYAVTAEAPPDAIVFVQLKTGSPCYKGVAREDGLLPQVNGYRDVRGLQEITSWEDLLAGWRRSLERLAADHRQGHAAVDPKSPTACERCGRMALCRVWEAQS